MFPSNFQAFILESKFIVMLFFDNFRDKNKVIIIILTMTHNHDENENTNDDDDIF